MIIFEDKIKNKIIKNRQGITSDWEQIKNYISKKSLSHMRRLHVGKMEKFAVIKSKKNKSEQHVGKVKWLKNHSNWNQN